MLSWTKIEKVVWLYVWMAPYLEILNQADSNANRNVIEKNHVQCVQTVQCIAQCLIFIISHFTLWERISMIKNWNQAYIDIHKLKPIFLGARGVPRKICLYAGAYSQPSFLPKSSHAVRKLA